MGLIDENEANGLYSPYIEYYNNQNLDNNRNARATDSDDSEAGSINLQRQVREPRIHRPRLHVSVSQENLANQGRKLGLRRRRRIDNLKYLMALDEKDSEVDNTCTTSNYDQKRTLFQDLLQNPEKMEIWNRFVESSEEDQSRMLNYRGLHNIKEENEDEDDHMEEEHREPTSEESWVMILDKRNTHPAYSPRECYSRVDKGLRSLLKRKQLPIGMLCNLEREIVTFFTEWPSSVYLCDINNSYERMLLHSLCQYLNLSSKSFDANGTRKTQIKNRSSLFRPPTLLLTEYLQQNQKSL